MINFFKKIYAYYIFLTADDWRLIWSESAQWVDSRNRVTNRSHYKIEYSLKKNMFRMKMEGYMCEHHSYYGTALKKMAEYNQNVLSKEFKRNESK